MDQFSLRGEVRAGLNNLVHNLEFPAVAQSRGHILRKENTAKLFHCGPSLTVC